MYSRLIYAYAEGQAFSHGSADRGILLQHTHAYCCLSTDSNHLCDGIFKKRHAVTSRLCHIFTLTEYKTFFHQRSSFWEGMYYFIESSWPQIENNQPTHYFWLLKCIVSLLGTQSLDGRKTTLKCKAIDGKYCRCSKFLRLISCVRTLKHKINTMETYKGQIKNIHKTYIKLNI